MINVQGARRDQSAGAHPGWSHPCAHGRALDSPAAGLRSWLRSTRDAARCRPAAPCRSCSCRRAHSALHGTGWPRANTQRHGDYVLCSLCNAGESAAARAQSCTFGFRGRRAGFGGDGRELRNVLGHLGAEESSAVSQLGFARIRLRHLGVAYFSECDQHQEDRGAVPAENRR